MDDINTKVKQKVLEQIMQMMDERENGFLKSKSPKFAKVEVATLNPKDLLSNDDDQEKPSDEMTTKDLKEDFSEGENPFNELDHKRKKLNPEEDEDLVRLLEMYEKIK